MRRIAFLQPCSLRSGCASYSIRLREAQEGDTTLQVLLEGEFMQVTLLQEGHVFYKDGLPRKHHKEDALNSS